MTLPSLWRHIILVTLLIGSMAQILEAKQVPERPSPPQLVNDLAGMLSPQEQRALERKLVAYNDSTSTQIAVVIENSLEGDDIFSYTVQLAESWGIGQRGKDNGILVFVASGDRQLRILTGYGVEGFLPDAAAKRIVDAVIVPKFKEGRFYQGLNEGTNVIMKLGSGEYTADDMTRTRESEGIPPIVIFIFIIFIFFLISNMQQRRYGSSPYDDDDDDGGYYRGGRYDRMPRRTTRSGGGGWIFLPGGGGGGFGPSGGGGFDGGGFGGFGGGSFGGGGAGGSW